MEMPSAWVLAVVNNTVAMLVEVDNKVLDRFMLPIKEAVQSRHRHPQTTNKFQLHLAAAAGPPTLPRFSIK
ncbi:MAG: hypothetical protein F6K50_50535 [Moorea sp. SIO3I7]|nr:hypothetical protein [Moorena sp. SIO3I7]